MAPQPCGPQSREQERPTRGSSFEQDLWPRFRDFDARSKHGAFGPLRFDEEDEDVSNMEHFSKYYSIG